MFAKFYDDYKAMFSIHVMHIVLGQIGKAHLS